MGCTHSFLYALFSTSHVQFKITVCKMSLIPKPVLHFTTLNQIKCKYKKVEETRQWLLLVFRPHMPWISTLIWTLALFKICLHFLKNGNIEWFIIYFSRKVAGVYFLNTLLTHYYKFISFKKTTLFHKNRFLCADYLHFKTSSLKTVNKK